MHKLDDYRGIVGDKILSDITRMAKNIYGARILHINSTYYGGGVAEMLYSIVPLLNDVGIETDWRILRGTPEFFTVTKKFHNGIQGDKINLTEIKKKLYLENNEDFASYCKIDADCVIIHDPQVLPLIRFYKRRQPWIWRCHIDLSHPNNELWEYLKGFILRYDRIIVSDKKYIKEDLPIEHTVIHPVIDPLSPKNMDIPASLMAKTLKKYGIPTDKPLITQVSRFDKWKDPENVVEIFKLVKQKADCRLVLLGSMASDDPEGWPIFERIKQRANNYLTKKDIILITSEDNILVNSLQRASAVVLQKSIREGFGLTVTEALWKERPVIASNVGGIPLQITDEETGYLVDPYDLRRCADLILSLLENPEKGKEMAARGKEHVRKNFLVTRHIYDDLDLLNKILNQ
ncbi:MAG: glycosyltransferase [Proteobacteria bacterium]|nr:glycosyltransferase [Pseudomonadota bacterium]MBU2227568.1 glycosyltransferase [Pseudomonadota bacterium]MBU2262992.1 glycosyltransferase [Pseudomonadota bacterium]